MSDPTFLAAEWLYQVSKFQAGIDRCTDTPAGKRLKEILTKARDECQAEYQLARNPQAFEEYDGRS